MSNSVGHGSLPYPIKGARFTFLIPYLSKQGDPTDPVTPDTEISKDGAAFADCTEEVSTIVGSNGLGFITLTGDELNATIAAVAAKVASGPKPTLLTIYPRVLPSIHTGTAQAGAAGSITLASGGPAFDISGCIVKTTGGTGGAGGSGSLNNQARLITAYNTSTKVATIEPDWETNPDSTTTYSVLLTELAVNSPVGRFLRPTTDERTLDVTATGEAGIDWANIGTPTNTNDLSGTTISIVGTVSGNVTGSIGSLATQAKADVNAEVDSALNTAIPGSPIANSINERIAAIDDKLPTGTISDFASSTDTVDIGKINGSSASAANLQKSTSIIITGSAVAGTLSTTQMSTDLTETTNDHYNGRIIIWTSGALLGQATDITDYNGVDKIFTFTAITEVATAGDTFVIL